MNIKPLTNQVLIRLLPPDYNTPGGLVLPDIAADTPHGEKSAPRKGVVMAIGPWRKTEHGFSILPDFHVGQRVLVSEYSGTKLTRNIGENLRLCRVDDVLAVVEEELV